MTDWVARGPLIAPVLARAIVTVVAAGFGVIAMLLVVEARADSGRIALSAGFLFVVLVAGTAPRVLPPLAAWPVYAVAALGMALIQNELTHSALDVAAIGAGTAVTAVAVDGLTRLAGLITELHAARSELAGAAIAHERLRFANDLHELLGLSLSAIAPKGELAHRLIESSPDRACRELSEITKISRRALADARAVAHGYRQLNLDEESRTAESVLAASRVEVHMELNLGELPVHIRGLLAAVLREGVANVLEHSHAEHCDIVMRQAGDAVSLDIVNDGVATGAWPNPGGGLATLANRVVGLGGKLTAGLEPGGRHRLHVVVPLAGEQAEEAVAVAGPGPRTPAGRLDRVLVAAVLCGIFTQSALLHAYLADTPTRYMVSVGCMAALLSIQLLYLSRPSIRLHSRMSEAILLLQATLVYLPLPVLGLPVLAAGFLAGSVLLVLRPVIGVPVFAVIALTAGMLQTGPLLNEVNGAAAVLVSGLVVYGLTWMARSVAELRAARIQLVHAAVAEERLRFARDLHDLLGLSLSAITLKSELAHRLVGAAPDQARQELTEILAISRLALADVRLVANGYRELSLDEEFRTAESLLAAAHLNVRMEVDYAGLPEEVSTLLATVLREGVTNVLRHSKGQCCDIIVRQCDRVVYTEIVNDGVAERQSGGSPGSGLHNLSYRVAMLGGDLTAGIGPDGRYRLRVSVPA